MTAPTRPARPATNLSGPSAEIRAELARVDAKASTLLAVAGVALSVGLAILGRTHLPLPATLTGWAATTAVGAAVALLAAAVRPHLGGNHGFMYWADCDPDQLRGTNPPAITPEQLIGLARLARAKYTRVRLAVDLILAGLAGTALTAILTALA